ADARSGDDAPESLDAKPASPQRLVDLPREREPERVADEARMAPRGDRHPRLLEHDPFPATIEQQPEPGALLRGMKTEPAMARDLARVVEPIPEPRFVPPLDRGIERMN